MSYEQSLRDAIELVESHDIDKIGEASKLYEEIAERAPAELSSLGHLGAIQGAALWRKVIDVGVRATAEIVVSLGDPALGVEQRVQLDDAGARFQRATTELLRFTSRRARGVDQGVRR